MSIEQRNFVLNKHVKCFCDFVKQHKIKEWDLGMLYAKYLEFCPLSDDLKASWYYVQKDVIEKAIEDNILVRDGRGDRGKCLITKVSLIPSKEVMLNNLDGSFQQEFTDMRKLIELQNNEISVLYDIIEKMKEDIRTLLDHSEKNYNHVKKHGIRVWACERRLTALFQELDLEWIPTKEYAKQFIERIKEKHEDTELSNSDYIKS